ncbi:TolC family protein [Albibacterium bauzanense]|uniref:Outer membrane protein TolC n=1 Tax=Albibacterium bauzanense TaxID=653929 RepID=A0A4R1M6S5_9SPHI|nr:TolC family protein [Albibacterium bauzanense]TCK85383.1 outer membrane protein TolC [Albibacterium bauzanense]
MKIGISIFNLLLIVWSLSVSAQDKDLNYFINASERNSPVFVDLQNQIQSLDLDNQQIKSSYGPQVSAGSNLMYAPVINGYGYDDAITNGQLVSALVTVNKELVGRKKLNAQLLGVELDKNALNNQYKLAGASLRKSITEQYVLVYGEQEQLLLSSEIMDLLYGEDQVLKLLTQKAVFTQTEYLTFNVTLKQRELAHKQLHGQYLNDLATLNYLSGIVDTTLQHLEKPAIKKLDETSFQNSIYYQSFQVDSLKNSNNEQLILQSYQPKLSVFADAGYQSPLITHAYKNMGFSVGLNLSIPIYDGGQRRIALAKNRLIESTAVANRDFSKQQYQQQILQIQQQVEQYNDILKLAEEQIQYSKTLVQANALQLQKGDVRVVDFVLSVNNYLDLRSAIIQNYVNQEQLINQLNYLLIQ